MKYAGALVNQHGSRLSGDQILNFSRHLEPRISSSSCCHMSCPISTGQRFRSSAQLRHAGVWTRCRRPLTPLAVERTGDVPPNTSPGKGGGLMVHRSAPAATTLVEQGELLAFGATHGSHHRRL